MSPAAAAREPSYVVLGLGSNVGERARHLERARAFLARSGFAYVLASTVWETEPVGGPAGQRPFLNQVLAARAADVVLEPERLLALCWRAEDDAGRRRGTRWGPRTLDVDILVYGTRRVATDALVLPHPRLAERGFAVGPLAEILPGLVVPGAGRTARDLWDALGAGRSCRPARGPRTMPAAGS